MPARDQREKTLYCSFCGKSQHEVTKLISGNSVYICNECIDLCNDIIKDVVPEEAKKADIGCPYPTKIAKLLGEHVIGQESAKQIIAVAVYNHHKRTKLKHPVEVDKSNILLIGPSGSGKTLFARSLARLLDVPFAIADATTLTEAGYVGDDVESVIQKLLANAGYDVEKAQKGIVYIDEIDKIARKSASNSANRDVSGEGVQQGLLKLIEGTKCSVPKHSGRKNSNSEMVEIDTTNILFICGGAFVGLAEVIERRSKRGGIGFSATLQSCSDETKNEMLKEVEPEDLLRFGIIPELIGRLPVLAVLEGLDRDALVRILTEPKNALLKQYQALFQADGIALEVTSEALLAIADRAIEKKTGARGLRSVLEKVFNPHMFSLPERASVEKIEKITVTRDVINGKGEPEIEIKKKTLRLGNG